MYRFLRNLLFCMPPERSHDFSLRALSWLERCGLLSLLPRMPESSPRYLWGLEFPNPVGLAAGLDKNGDHIDAMAALGFGFIEIGTVTPRPQAGNPRPRLFRAIRQQAIINRMGFNNKGVDYLVERVRHRRRRCVLGINIGKNADTPLEHAVDDYLHCMRKVFPYADYIVVNLSSPNTAGLRQLQFGESMENLLSALQAEKQMLVQQHGREVPVLIKIAPDVTDDDIVAMASAFNRHRVDGVIATNTTVDKSSLGSDPLASEQGGLSGLPLMAPSTHVLTRLRQCLADSIPVIGVGGIASGEDARAKLAAGASLVQIYTGFIYQGPALVRACIAALR